ncbi:MAG: A24 family peptidase [Gammaproteobacteria bacterium]|nr:A24 family peptidase [Gammaproteobacteria bacterium]
MSIWDVFQYNAVVFYGVVAFLSLFVGSFLNVVIHRLPIMMENAWRQGLAEWDEAQAEAQPAANSVEDDIDADISSVSVNADALTHSSASATEPFNLAVPRSRCPKCGTLITAWQNIPVLSWLLLRGKCHQCKTPISARYPLVELSTMLLSLVVAWHLGPTPQAVLGIVVTWFFVTMSMIDFDHQLLPDSLTLPLMWLALIASLFPVFTDVRSAVIGAAAGYLVLWSVFHVFRLITGKEGMGYGDFKLLAAIGALLGWQSLPVVILLSSLVGAVVGITVIAITGRDKNIPIPFGPFLAAAGWIAMLWGDTLTDQYLGLFA